LAEHFYVEKQSGTFADTLLAFGWARCLRQLLHEQHGKPVSVRMLDDGSHYRLVCALPLSADFVQAFTGTLIVAPPILPAPKQAYSDEAETSEEDEGMPDIASIARQANCVPVEIAKEREKYNHYQELRKAFSQGVPQDSQPAEPSRYWHIYRALSAPASLKGYNRLIGAWLLARSLHGALLNILCILFENLPNNLERAEAAWRALAKQRSLRIDSQMTALQIYNPEQGKGQNQPKARQLTMRNLKNFWLIEFLKAVGFYDGAVPQLLQDAKDRKTYVLVPTDIDTAQSSQILEAFRYSFPRYRSITSDVMAILRYIETFLKHSLQAPDLEAFLFNQPSLRNLVAGFQVAFYKDMGNAQTMMNFSFIGLPPWMKIRRREDVPALLSQLDVLRRVVRSMDESHSDAITLLSALRDFLSSGNLNALFTFTAGYSGYYMSQRERNRFAQQLSIALLEEIIMSVQPRYAEIFQNQGFRNVAYAIRQSTVNAQYAKIRGERRYDIRYGLGQELIRKARRPEEFLTALAEFIAKYNAENAQIAERDAAAGRTEVRRRRSVATSDLEQIAALIDQHGAALIANLLVAYGYASDRRAADDETPPETDGLDTEQDS
jgi:hypothetical protein